MKKIILLTTLVAFISVSAFAQKGSFKKNTFSENIGLLSPVNDWSDGFYESGVSLKLSYSRNFTKSFGLTTGFNYGSFNLNDDFLKSVGGGSNSSGPRFFNMGIGCMNDWQIGNSGFFLGINYQLLLGLFQDEEIKDSQLSQYSTYGMFRNDYFQFGGSLGLQMYKTFGVFGFGIESSYNYSTPLAENFAGDSGLIEYITCQLKLVQKF